MIFLNRIKNRFDNEMRTIVVQSLALSIMNYCLKIWGSTTKQQVQRVQKLQNFAAKVIDGKAKKFDHASPILKKLEWLNIREKIEYDLCILIFKLLHNLLPAGLFTLDTVGARRERTTRANNNLFIHRTVTDIGGRSLVKQGSLLWNKLPNSLKRETNVNSFKQNLKKYILSS